MGWFDNLDTETMFWIFVAASIMVAMTAMWNIMEWYEGLAGIVAVITAAVGIKLYIDDTFAKKNVASTPSAA